MVDSQSHDTLTHDLVDDVPVVRLARTQLVFEQAVELFEEAIRQAIAAGHPHVLLDVREVGFAPPSLAERSHMVRRWAHAADGRLRIAMLVPPAFIDPERFGVVAAGNYGLAAQVFVQQADALAWLREEWAAEQRRR